jgi:hypothetical protein
MRSNESLTMPNRREDLGLLAICAIFVVLSLAGLAAAFLTRLVTNIDGLLLIVICLMMGGLFSLMVLGIAKEEGWLPSGKKKQEGGTVQSAKPGEGK